jgi:hypothetical protein
MMRKIVWLLLYALYSGFVFVLVQMNLGMPDRTKFSGIFSEIFLDGNHSGDFSQFNYFAYMALLGLSLIAVILISKQTWDLAQNYMQFILLRSKSKKAFLLRLTLDSAVNSLLLIAGFCAGIFAAASILTAQGIIKFDIFLSIGTGQPTVPLAVNYLCFFVGLNLCGFSLKLKHGSTSAITISVMMLILLPVIDYAVPIFAILTFGKATESLLGIAISFLWMLINGTYARSTIRKIDLI